MRPVREAEAEGEGERQSPNESINELQGSVVLGDGVMMSFKRRHSLSRGENLTPAAGFAYSTSGIIKSECAENRAKQWR